ncbi:MAG: glycosyltransferase family 4 protein [Cyclobacteriaceae bacterium]|nr:glycosyltransferase family 4 protein [Cyclobacteriaceae bacterium]
MKKLAIITTHPIQYNAPFFKLLTERGKVEPKVFYTWPQAIEGFKDTDFGNNIQWDIPLLEGYEWEAVENASKNPNSKSWGGIDCPTLIRKIKTFQPDVILVYGWNLKSHFKAMRYFNGKVSVWFTGDSTLLDEKGGWRKIVRRIWLRWVYRQVDKAFYVGANNKKYFQAHGIKEEQLVFFPHAIDNERFADNEERQYEVKALKWRRELGYSNDDIVLLFAGKFEAKKNPQLLIEVIKGFQHSTRAHRSFSEEGNQPTLPAGRKIKLLMIGNGPLEKELKQMANDDMNIQFLPFQNQSVMPIVYRLGNLFCLPSQSETWGLVINETLSSGRPVIVSSKVGCANDLVVENVSGIVFNYQESFDLKEVLLTLIKSDLKQMRAKCLNHIQDWSFINKCVAIENAIDKD